MSQFVVILPAAGRSSRFGRNKLLEPLAGVPVIVRTIRAFANHPDVASIVVATNDKQIADLLRSESSKLTICPGGDTRADSVRSALTSVPADDEFIAVHDAARPLISRDLIDKTFAAAHEHGAAVPALPVSLTIKQSKGPLPAKVLRTLDRTELWSMQTPQVARREDLLRAFEQCPIPLSQITDDVQLLELQNQPVWLIPGDARNIKITTTLDLKLAELLLNES